MSKKLNNSGITILNFQKVDSVSPATLIVLGVPRSGTSMIASTLRNFGVFMGTNLDDVVHEDKQIAHALLKSPDRLEHIIKNRNSQHDYWGFKRPDAFRFILPHIPKFRNPKIIIPFRDPAAIAKRNQVSVHSDYITALRNAAKASAELVEFLSMLNIPTMLISYEKALIYRKTYVQKLANFTNQKLSTHQIQTLSKHVEVEPKAYLRATHIELEGRFYGVKNGVAKGWARHVGIKKPVKVSLISNQEVIASGQANIYVPHLECANKNNGLCGFKIKLPDEVEPKTIHAVIEPYKFRIKDKW